VALKGVDAGLARPSTVRTFVSRASVPGSRALGWDTMLPTSSCGTKMSASAFGHTGFTGTSLWIDPATDTYIILLTNAVHPRGKGSAISLRAKVATAVAAAIPVSAFVEVAVSDDGPAAEPLAGQINSNGHGSLSERLSDLSTGAAAGSDAPVLSPH
jgi:CubicO group peptidase (beta-lactamase class C family)